MTQRILGLIKIMNKPYRDHADLLENETKQLHNPFPAILFNQILIFPIFV
jgi:hypothetical protein